MEETPAEQLVFCTLLGPEGPDLEELARVAREPNLWTSDIRWMSRSTDSCVTGLVQAQ
jgi:hypothetical protein